MVSRLVLEQRIEDNLYMLELAKSVGNEYWYIQGKELVKQYCKEYHDLTGRWYKRESKR